MSSSNPSQLGGYVKVAGQRAEVIIANPAGINVNGGGFINASSVTLTTGTAMLNSTNGGSLDGYRVQGGAISLKGRSDGLDTSFTNTQIAAGNTAIIQSGGDTTLKGAVIAANTVKAALGGNLRIESLQDTSTYASEQKNISASVSVGGSGNGGSFSASQSKIDSNFASVGQQSGIKAGDGGFQVTVNNNTDLKGGVIASNQAAVDNNKNSFTTGGRLTTSGIQNTASYNGSALVQHPFCNFPEQ